jgi:hypothetical protein
VGRFLFGFALRTEQQRHGGANMITEFADPFHALLNLQSRLEMMA